MKTGREELLRRGRKKGLEGTAEKAQPTGFARAEPKPRSEARRYV